MWKNRAVACGVREAIRCPFSRQLRCMATHLYISKYINGRPIGQKKVSRRKTRWVQPIGGASLIFETIRFDAATAITGDASTRRYSRSFYRLRPISNRRYFTPSEKSRWQSEAHGGNCEPVASLFSVSRFFAMESLEGYTNSRRRIHESICNSTWRL